MKTDIEIAKEAKMLPITEIAKNLGIEPDRVSVKFTTTEKLGFAGRGEGIAAEAVVLIKRKSLDRNDA